MPQHRKRGNPHRLPKQHQKRYITPSTNQEPHAPLTDAPPAAPMKRVRLTLHERDPITGNEDSLCTLFYEFYRGYTIYSTAEGRCCIHSRWGCIQLRGQFVCLPDVEEAKSLIKRFRAQGYTSSERSERHLPRWGMVCLNGREVHPTLSGSRSVPRIWPSDEKEV